jgi:hypothetical protein
MTSKNKGLDKTLEHLRAVAVDTNAVWAERLGIPVCFYHLRQTIWDGITACRLC